MTTTAPSLDAQLKDSLSYLDCLAVATLAIRQAQRLAEGDEPNYMALGCISAWALAAKSFNREETNVFEQTRLRRELAKLTEKVS